MIFVFPVLNCPEVVASGCLYAKRNLINHMNNSLNLLEFLHRLEGDRMDISISFCFCVCVYSHYRLRLCANITAELLHHSLPG